MTSETNTVSIIMPYVEDRGFLEEAIDSVLWQTYTDFELIKEQSDRTQGYNINRGLEKATGEFIKILHDDDLMFPECLEILVPEMEGYDFVYGDSEVFGDTVAWDLEPGRIYDKTVTFESMLIKNGISFQATLYRADVLRAVGGWDETLCTAEEYDLHLRLLKAGYKHKHVDALVAKYRLHSSNKSNLGRHWRGRYIDNIKSKYV